jgi:hypothetical protein
VIWVRGLPISVRARAVWVDIVKLKRGCQLQKLVD